jgi:hypothetical protein
MTANRLVKGFGSPNFPALPRARSTAAQKIAICRSKEGERRDSNPRPPGPQPGASTCDRTVPDRVQRTVETRYPRVEAVRSRVRAKFCACPAPSPVEIGPRIGPRAQMPPGGRMGP